ncbi:hypothetical protein BDR03DRAFT_440480 [Suillus americanus]|nr:hypothetical protein BDR03DRAFT_440480 [Suillus americanus]
MMLAAEKLCKSKTFDPNDTNQALALLSQRFDLNICFGRLDAVPHIETGVANHLRVCFSTTDNMLWSFTGYPSEPLLSCVAAILLHTTLDHLRNALRVLKENVDGGMVEIGPSGELTGRLFLLLAKDLFVSKDPSRGVIQDLHYDGRQNAELIDCQKVSVIEFLEHLFGETFWSRTVEAKTAFQHAYINFSHWATMTELIASPDDFDTVEESSAGYDGREWTLQHWHRTSAVQYCHSSTR